MLEELLGVRLRKEHSAADWSTRPIPVEWLVYAALDVELLIELRDASAAQLEQAGKTDWAREEFDALVAGAGPGAGREDPWRRRPASQGPDPPPTSYVAELWYARDEIAQAHDRAPGRILADVAITDLATAPIRAHRMRRIPDSPDARPAATTTSGCGRCDRRPAEGSELPPMHRPNEGPPPPRLWSSQDPAAAARLAAARKALDTAGPRNGAAGGEPADARLPATTRLATTEPVTEEASTRRSLRTAPGRGNGRSRWPSIAPLLTAPPA